MTGMAKDTQAGTAVMEPQALPFGTDGTAYVVPRYEPRSREPRERIILMLPPDLKKLVQSLATAEGRTDNAMTELVVRIGLVYWLQSITGSNPDRSLFDQAVRGFQAGS